MLRSIASILFLAESQSGFSLAVHAPSLEKQFCCLYVLLESTIVPAQVKENALALSGYMFHFLFL
jgi:hypothetical protein